MREYNNKINDDVVIQAENIFNSIGLTLDNAFDLFLSRAVDIGGLPLTRIDQDDIKLDNEIRDLLLKNKNITVVDHNDKASMDKFFND